MKKNEYIQEVEDWIKLAGDDLKIAKTIIEQRDPAWAAGFHCQQVAEKALKALLLHETKSYPKQHDLIKLAQTLKQSGLDVDSIYTELDTLTNYYVGTRYPGVKEYKVTRELAIQAIEQAENVLKFVTKILNTK